VRRQEFVTAMLSAFTGATVPVGLAGAGRLGQRDVSPARRGLALLYELDDQHGGGAVYGLAVRAIRQARSTLERASYEQATGRALRAVVGQLTEHAGWLAYDAGRQPEARYWWLEALHAARMAHDEQAEVVVFASMSLQAGRTGQPREAAELAQAAQRAARSRMTPRLRAVLLAREAVGYAGGGDRAGATCVLSQALTELERGHRDDDPPWLEFFDHADLAWHEMLAAADLGDLSWAERAARQALGSADEVDYPRNHALYLAQLADILAASGRVEEALPVTAQVVVRVPTLDSDRVTRQTTTVLRRLAAHRGDPQVRDLLDWAGQVMHRAAAEPVVAPGPV